MNIKEAIAVIEAADSDNLVEAIDEPRGKRGGLTGKRLRSFGMNHLNDDMGEMIKKDEEISRLKAGNFTPEEFQNLCHSLEEDDSLKPCDFAAGCIEYQKKLFGESPTEQEIARLKDRVSILETRLYGSIEHWKDDVTAEDKAAAQEEADREGVRVLLNVHGSIRWTAYPRLKAELRIAHTILDLAHIAKGDGSLRDRLGLLLQLNATLESDKLHLKSTLLEILKDVGDMSMDLKEDTSRLFDKSFHWACVNKATYTCVDAREKFFKDVPLHEMTNNKDREESIKRALEGPIGLETTSES